MPNRQSASPAQAARAVLDRLRLGRTVPIPVEKVAKGLGAVLKFSPLDDELSGMIFIKDGTPIIGVNSLHHPNRQRFTIAHECAHLELHRSRLSNKVHVDKKFPVLMRDGKSAMGTQRIEIEANQFAAELLMPYALIEAAFANKPVDIEDDGPLEALARKFKVSKQTLEYRLRNLSGNR